MKKQRGRNRMKRMGAVLLSVFCVLAAVLVLQTSGQPESGEHVAQAATSPASEEAATQAGNAGGGQDSGRAGAETTATAMHCRWSGWSPSGISP